MAYSVTVAGTAWAFLSIVGPGAEPIPHHMTDYLIAITIFSAAGFRAGFKDRGEMRFRGTR